MSRPAAAPRELTTPLEPAEIERLHAGDEVLLSGVIYTARDAAHERLTRMIAAGDPLPVNLAGEIIYYCGPTPARPGRPIGSAGPTTASRMDPYAPSLLEHGVRGMIGKGRRSAAVKDTIRRAGAVYFAAVEGTAALLGRCVRSAEVVAFPDLGAEAIYRLVVERFPVVVANDCHGGDVYDEGRAKFRR
ncbi:MAG: Fe-S-containing hydro-lyase [bacterium]